MSKPLLNFLRTNNRLKESIFPAPVGGLNLLSSYETMPKEDALEMDNFLPKTNAIELRKGYKLHAKIGQKGAFLLPFKSTTGADKLLAFLEGKVLDVTQKGDYSNAISDLEYEMKIQNLNKGVFASNNWQYVLFKERAYLANGIDAVQVYIPDETRATSGEIKPAEFQGEGFMPQKITHIFVAKQRLWFVEKNTLRVWYTKEAGTVQGEVVPFDMSMVSSFGGTLIAGAQLTKDGGEGLDDLVVFITSEGETLIYEGTNPNSATDWTLKGVYKMPAPVGNNPFLKHKGDLILTSQEGYVPLLKTISLEGQTALNLSFGAKIAPLVQERVRFFKSKEGWQSLIYPKGGYALFNVPLSTGFEQHIYNTTTGAWSRFTGIKAKNFALFQEKLYFINEEGVFEFDTGSTDGENPICGSIRQAYNNLLSENEKRVLMLKPKFKSTKNFALEIFTDTDFAFENLPYQLDVGEKQETNWNELKWSTLKPTIKQETSNAKWARLIGQQKNEWICNIGQGVYFSLVLKTKTRGVQISFFGTGVRYE